MLQRRIPLEIEVGLGVPVKKTQGTGDENPCTGGYLYTGCSGGLLVERGEDF
jgi:hypothetical protein